ncbi:sensor domain-containing diguanylate cyclase [Fusibacter bizertensis]
MRGLYFLKGYRKAFCTALIIGMTLLLIFTAFSIYEYNRVNQMKQIKATEYFAVFDNVLNNLVYTNINLMKGFAAYIKVNPNLEDAEIYAYLDELLKSQSNLINNVGILKDTTIMWNYPFELNKATIGADLAQVKEQSPSVLSVKQNGKPIFQGPINLLQGGTGFIIRSPIYQDNNQYWGQISIVLKGEQFVEKIKNIESSLNVKAIILSGDQIVYGSESLLDENVHWFKFADELFAWDLGIVINGVNALTYLNVYIFLGIGIILLIVITIASFVMLKSNEIIKHESLHDHLTGLRNRNSLDETMQQLFAAAKRNDHKVGVLLLDLNKFKEINDTFGHTMGDAVLKETATRLNKAARKDEVLFRVGGDEFLLVVPVVQNREILSEIKRRFQSVLSYKFESGGYSIIVTSSIGCAISGDDGNTLDELFLKADRRMYDEKHKVI